VQEPDHRHGRLLRTRRERPCGCGATDKPDELAPLQLMGLHPPPNESLRWMKSAWFRTLCDSRIVCWQFAFFASGAELEKRVGI
jgi:hypothetical protein